MRKAINENDDPLYICAACCGQRGYTLPADGMVGTAKCKCAMCDKFDHCFMLEDLVFFFKTLDNRNQ